MDQTPTSARTELYTTKVDSNDNTLYPNSDIITPLRLHHILEKQLIINDRHRIIFSPENNYIRMYINHKILISIIFRTYIYFSIQKL